ncbi:hypothetical protein D9758_015957 [Tetrapyrgos nigripes]|uniref:Uncharacterized protein n=1 Tax=Tetrapyrgos nigripes TaxID=182062 RepID=A0A8H5C0F8_9AGAR|nr:hypothetical protein D9758_015957 [Tetrapyrgos nigripes]
MAENASSSRSLVILFVSLHTFVWIASTFIILTVVLSRNVQRQSTWFNLNLSWIFACFSFALLLTAGQLFKPQPNGSICLAQAAASTSVPSLTSGATLAFALHLWFNMRSSSHLDRLELRRATLRNIALLVVPYIIPLVEFVAAFAYGIQHPNQVVLDSTGMLCGLTTDVFAKLSAISVSVIMFMTLIFESWIIYMIYLSWRSKSINSPIRGTAGLATVIRLIAFTVFTIVGIGASLTFLTTKGADAASANLLQSIPPASFVFIFGFQWDIIRVWMFWRKDTQMSSDASIEGISRSPSPVMEVKVDLVRTTSYPREEQVKVLEV